MRHVRLVSRRGALAAGVSAPLMLSVPASRAMPRLDLSTPRAQLTAFMKLLTSLKAETVFYWYTGVIDVAAPGHPICPVVGVDTLIRRRTEPQPDGSFHIVTWEADIFHALGENVPLARLKNPITGRMVEPFQFREGMLTYVYSEHQHTPVVLNGDAAQMKQQTSRPFGMAWHQVGDMIWMTREVYVDFANPLDPTRWRLESEGPRLRFCLASTHTGKISELADPSVSCAGSAFSLASMGGCFPWMMMGGTGAVQMWRATGLKLRSAAELPAPVHAMFAQVHPRIFADVPWTDHELPWAAYARLREPEK
jgi:hypothetical protein